jgi:hypothetical protein
MRNTDSASQNLPILKSRLCCRKTTHSRKQVQKVNSIHHSGTFIPAFTEKITTAAMTGRQTTAKNQSLALGFPFHQAEGGLRGNSSLGHERKNTDARAGKD